MNKELKEIIEKSKNIVLFSGAGISCGSGIPDFRSANGIYNEKIGGKFRPEEIVSHNFLEKYPEEFYSFYKAKMVYPNAGPNLAHKYFAELEKEGKLKAVITQNIDGLHYKAGNRNVYELHGSVYRNYCIRCGKRFGLEYIMADNGVPECDECGGKVRPDVVLYGEQLDEDVWEGAAKTVAAADTMIIVGTSLTVYPAANMVAYFNGNNLVLINKDITPYDSAATLILHEDIENVLKGARQ